MKESLKNFCEYNASDEEIQEGYTEETYLSMIAERIEELKSLQLEFIHSLDKQ